MKRAMIASLVISSLSSSHALATSAEEREAYQYKLFANFDQNNDGMLTEKEFMAQVITGLFKKFDRNGNGVVTKKEYLKHSKDKAQAKMEYPILDPTSKGHITPADVYRHTAFINELKTAFKRLDTQSKGYITIKDLPDVTPHH